MFRVVFIVVVFLGGLALSQDTLSQDMSLTELRQEALKLTFESRLSDLPSAVKAEGLALLDRAETLREPLTTLREKMLTAYIAELQNGKEPYLARATAKNSVADEWLELLPEIRSLAVDIRAFVNEHPEVAPIFKELRDRFRENRLNNAR
jgi:hypothetical protein